MSLVTERNGARRNDGREVDGRIKREKLRENAHSCKRIEAGDTPRISQEQLWTYNGESHVPDDWK